MTVAFALLGLMLGRIRDLSPAAGRRLIAALAALPEQIEEILDHEEEIAEVARKYAQAKHMFFIGRVRGWPVAREGAQKLKEISYVHAEAYQGSELKHGPLALIDDTDAERRHRPGRRTGQQERLDDRADQGPRRPGHRGDERRTAGRPGGRRRDPGPGDRARTRAESC